MRLVDYVITYLEKKGISTCYVLTGNGAMYINDAIAKSKKIKYFAVRHEATAPMMAESYSRITNNPALVSITSGPGATNAISGLAEAWVDAGKVLIISGQSPLNQIPQMKIRSFGTAGIDIIPIVNSITKYAVTVTKPEEIKFHLDKAFYLMNSGRPGPVWIDLPMDIQYANVVPKKLITFKLPREINKVDKKTFNDLISALDSSRKPLLIFGQGVRQSNSIPLVKKLIGRLKIPFAFSRLAHDMLPYSYENNMGQIGRRGQKYSDILMQKADFILSMGCRLSVPLAGENLCHFSKDAFICMVDIDKNELSFNKDRLNLSINVNINNFLKFLLNNYNFKDLKPWVGWRDYCKKLKTRFPIYDLHHDFNKIPMDLYFFMTTLDRLAKKNTILITDAGSNYYVGGQVFRFESWNREITSGAYAAMGLSIPLSIGAATAKPNNTIIAVTGDGSLELNIQDLKTISYYSFNIKLFVINNGGYVSMRNWQDSFFEGRRIGSDEASGSEMLNLKKVADAFDLDYLKIDSPKNLEKNISMALKFKGPLFIEVITDCNQKIINPFNEGELTS